MRLVDAHCHLESGEFAHRLDRVLDAARSAGVVGFVTCSIEPGQWAETLSLAAAHRHRGVVAALGIHPWYIAPGDRARIPALAAARERGAAAIGEIGLDRKLERVPFDEQLTVFEDQLAVAREIDLPVSLHCRGAFNELIQCLKRVGAPRAGGWLHNFTGSAELAQDLTRFGLSFSLGGVLTYRPSRKRTAMLKAVYPDRLLLETDSPDIPPVGTEFPNEPANLRLILGAAARLLDLPEEEVAAATTANALRLVPALMP